MIFAIFFTVSIGYFTYKINIELLNLEKKLVLILKLILNLMHFSILRFGVEFLKRELSLLIFLVF